MPETITCTRYGSPCTMSMAACRARWELARSDRYTEIYLDPCLSCPVHESEKAAPKKRTGWKRPARKKPVRKKSVRAYKSRSLVAAQAMGYRDLGTALEDMYSRQEKTTIEIAAMLGTTAGSVSNLLRLRGVKMRGKSAWKSRPKAADGVKSSFRGDRA